MLRILWLILVLVLLPIAQMRGELVGYKFEGAFTGSSSSVYNLFNIDVPRNSKVTGTFSYDTNYLGVDVATGKRTYHQDIYGGYTLNINNGAIKLSASDYIVTVGNDQTRSASTIDLFSVDFDHAFGPTTPILVNGTPWTGAIGFLKVELTWPSETFTDVDEPKLTSTRPETSNSLHTAWVGSAAMGTGAPARTFGLSPPFPLKISRIDPLSGDYNRDGAIDANDWYEWRRTFGSTTPTLHADGNNDGVVDAADYVVWRRALASASGSSLQPFNAPEPTFMALVILSALLFPVRFRAK